MKKPLSELMTLLSLVGDIYKKPRVKILDDIDWWNVLRLASKNRILYYSIKRILDSIAGDLEESFLRLIMRLKSIGDLQLMTLNRTLQELNNTLEEEYLLIKTYKSYPYITYDVDILVSRDDIEKTLSLLKKHGFTIRRAERYKLIAKKDGLLPVSIHKRIAWHSITVLDENLMWNEPLEANYQGIKVLLPSIEGDLLTHLAHIAFELYYIALGDFLYICKLLEKANWHLVLEQAKKHRWIRSMETILITINKLHNVFYGEDINQMKTSSPRSMNELKMPYIYSTSFVIRSLMEKKAIKQLPWEVFFFTYRRFKIKLTDQITYLHSYLYFP